MERKKAFQINEEDNVATALEKISEGEGIALLGDGSTESVLTANETIPVGHKVALWDIAKDDTIIKYGVVIGQATQDIVKGGWVHLHCVRSLYDQRSEHLDVITGAPKDIRYE